MTTGASGIAARLGTARMLALTTRYAFEPCLARPGTGHDKGGVESRGRALRWQHLVPIPSGPDLDTISAGLLARLDHQAATRRHRQGRSIAERFEAERRAMIALPAPPFRAAAGPAGRGVAARARAARGRVLLGPL